MDTQLSLAALAALYAFYDQFVANMPLSCGPGCATCCSVNVSVTSLEASYLLQHPLMASDALAGEIRTAAAAPHFLPSLTTNQLAASCLAAQEPPEENGVHTPGICPLLDEDGLCRVYSNRPFSCRAMLSVKRCRTGGEAEVPPFVYTVNLALYQLIEHLDRQGTSGNLLDMLSGNTRNAVANRALPGFLVAPEERAKFHTLLKKIAVFPVGNSALNIFFPEKIFSAF